MPTIKQKDSKGSKTKKNQKEITKTTSDNQTTQDITNAQDNTNQNSQQPSQQTPQTPSQPTTPSYPIMPPPGIVFKLKTDEMMLYPTRQSMAMTYRTVDPFALEWNDLVAYPAVERWLDTYNQKQNWYQDLVRRAEQERAAMMGQLGRGGGIQQLWGGGGVGGGMVGRSRYGGEIGLDIPAPPEFTAPPDLYKNPYITEQFSAATTETPIKPPADRGGNGGGWRDKRALSLGIVGSISKMTLNNNNPISKSVVPYSTYPLSRGTKEVVDTTSSNLFQLTDSDKWDLRAPQNTGNLLKALFNVTPSQDKVTLHYKTKDNQQQQVTVQINPQAPPIATITEIVSQTLLQNEDKLNELAGIIKYVDPNVKNKDALLAQYADYRARYPNASLINFIVSKVKSGTEAANYDIGGSEDSLQINLKVDQSKQDALNKANNVIGALHTAISKIFLDYGFANKEQNPLLSNVAKTLKGTTAYEAFLSGSGKFNYDELAKQLATVFAANVVSEAYSGAYRRNFYRYGDPPTTGAKR